MRAINHALTGAVIGLSLPLAVAIPLAPVSHYALDALPHWGRANAKIGDKLFQYELIIDAALCFALVVVLFIARPDRWLSAAVCAFLAAGVDFMWIPTYLKMRRGGARPTYTNPFIRLHKWIQWYERPLGSITEVLWASGMVTLMIARL